MELIGFVIYFGLLSSNIEQENISFSENIDYCTNIIHNPNMTDQFQKSCDLDETNKYIMLVKNNFN